MEINQFGQTFVPPTATSTSGNLDFEQLVVQLSSPTDDGWLITLPAWEGTAGVQRNQTVIAGSRFDRADGNSNYAGALARIKWGTVNVSTEALVDYPTGGASFHLVAASSVQISVLGQSVIAHPVPLVGGFATPTSRAQRVIGMPTLTLSAILINDDQSVPVNIPRRAVGFRPIFFDDQTTAEFDQFTAVPVGTGEDAAASGVTNLGAQAVNRTFWFPLNPASQTLNIHNTSGGPRDIAVQWIIEL
jgi:hypothetical protein